MFLPSSVVELYITSFLFVNCPYTQEVWLNLEAFSGIYSLIQKFRGVDNCWSVLINDLSAMHHGKYIWSTTHRILLAAIVYFIWQERNLRIHLSKSSTATSLSVQIVDLVKMKLLGMKVKNSA